jgi:zinc transport system permease protein
MAEIITNNIIAGIFLSFIFGIVSIFVILRKLSFLGVGISHSCFAGVALSLLLSTNLFFTTLFFALATAFLIGKTTKMGKIEYDNSIGLFFSFTMALGSIFLFFYKGYNFDIMSYLFGSILGITKSDVVLIVFSSILFSVIIMLFFKELVFIAFDEEVAFINGINVNFFDTLLLIIITTIIVLAIKVIGIILVSALLILPGSFSFLVSKNYRISFLVSIFFTVFIYFAGFFLSWNLDLPSGATIVTFGSIIYFLTLLVNNYK